jgi:hypothetical protein
MALAPLPVGDANGTSHLEVWIPAAGARDRVLHVLGAGRDLWLGEQVRPAGDEPARYLLDLELRVGERMPRVSFRKAALVDLGEPRLDGGGVTVDIAWRAYGMTPLFPVFAGILRWNDGVLRVEGVYAPPGGAVGAVADRLLLNVAARGTARRLLERIASAIDGEPEPLG